MDRHSVSPFYLSRTLQAGGGSLVLYSLSGSPVIKQLMQIVTMVPGQGRQFQCASPNTTLCNLTAFMQLETNPVTQLQMQGANSKNKTVRIIVKIVFHHGALVNISQNEAVQASGICIASIILFMCLII